jgi:hypothetical protein
MELPIIVVDRAGDVDMFATVEAVAQYLEPIDVAGNEYTAYDSAGRLLELRVERKKVLLLSVLDISPGEQVVIAPAEIAPTHANELRERLAAYLHALGASPVWLAQASLADLVGRGWEQYQRA